MKQPTILTIKCQCFGNCGREVKVPRAVYDGLDHSGQWVLALECVADGSICANEREVTGSRNDELGYVVTEYDPDAPQEEAAEAEPTEEAAEGDEENREVTIGMPCACVNNCGQTVQVPAEIYAELRPTDEVITLDCFQDGVSEGMITIETYDDLGFAVVAYPEPAEDALSGLA